MAPGPKRSASSKRNDNSWVTSTLYLRDTSKDRMARYLTLRDLVGGNGPADQSEVIDAALVAYLDKELPKLELAAMKHLQAG
jgi:hypothetical protein